MIGISPCTLKIQELQIRINEKKDTSCCVTDCDRDLFHKTGLKWSARSHIAQCYRNCYRLRHNCSITLRTNVFLSGIENNGKESQWLKVRLKHCSNLVSISVLFWHNWSSFLSCHLLIEFSRRINASPLERDTGRGGHYRAFLD